MRMIDLSRTLYITKNDRNFCGSQYQFKSYGSWYIVLIFHIIIQSLFHFIPSKYWYIFFFDDIMELDLFSLAMRYGTANYIFWDRYILSIRDTNVRAS